MLVHDEMKQLAGQEIQVCKSRLMKVQEDIRDALIPKDEADEHAAIIEIRAGILLRYTDTCMCVLCIILLIISTYKAKILKKGMYHNFSFCIL